MLRCIWLGFELKTLQEWARFEDAWCRGMGPGKLKAKFKLKGVCKVKSAIQINLNWICVQGLYLAGADGSSLAEVRMCLIICSWHRNTKKSLLTGSYHTLFVFRFSVNFTHKNVNNYIYPSIYLFFFYPQSFFSQNWTTKSELWDKLQLPFIQ